MEITVIDVIKQMAVAVPAIMLGTQTLTAALHGIFKMENKNAVHALSWIISILAGLGFVAFNGLTFGLPVWADYLMGGVCGLIVGGASNGVYDWPAVSKFFDSITALFGKKKEK